MALLLVAGGAWAQKPKRVFEVTTDAQRDQPVFTTIGVPVGATAAAGARRCRNDAFAIHLGGHRTEPPELTVKRLSKKLGAQVPELETLAAELPVRATEQEIAFRKAIRQCRAGTLEWTLQEVVPSTDYLLSLRCDPQTGPRSALIGLPQHRLCPFMTQLADVTKGQIARECDSAPSASGWATPQIGRPSGATLTGDGARIAIIDTCDDASKRECRHGAGVRAIIERLAPDAKIESVVGLATADGGPIADVARALVWVAQQPHPFIVNLSLGWPPEFQTPSQVGDRSCQFVEAEAGLSVQSALKLLGPKSVVFAAAGNRPPWLGPVAQARAPFMPAGFSDPALAARVVTVDQFSPTDAGLAPEKRPPPLVQPLTPAGGLRSLLELIREVHTRAVERALTHAARDLRLGRRHVRHDNVEFVAPGTDVRLFRKPNSPAGARWAELTGTGSSYATAYATAIAALVIEAAQTESPGVTLDTAGIISRLHTHGSVAYNDPTRRLVHPEAANKDQLVRPVLTTRRRPLPPPAGRPTFSPSTPVARRTRSHFVHGSVSPTPLPSCPDPDDCAVLVYDDKYIADISVILDRVGGMNPSITITWPSGSPDVITLVPDPLATTNTSFTVKLTGLSMFSSKGDYQLDFDVVDSNGKYEGRQSIALKKFWP